MTTIELVVAVAVVTIGATLGILKLIAPKTKTLKDDKAIEILEKIETVLKKDGE